MKKLKKKSLIGYYNYETRIKIKHNLTYFINFMKVYRIYTKWQANITFRPKI